MQDESRPTMHICVTCRDGPPPAQEEAVRPGRLLFQALRERAGPHVSLREVECLSNCARGCSAAISMGGKWTYLLGGLHAGLAEDLLDYARSYAASKTGTIMPSRRAASLRDMIVGRVPG